MIFKNYKKLYKNELKNREMLINQLSKISAENVEYQKQTKMYKERCARLTIDLEDVDNLLKVETDKLNSAKKEIKNLKRKNTMLNKLTVEINGKKILEKVVNDGK